MTTAHRSWTVLDTAFGNGNDFLARCARWRTDNNRGPMLHYVGLLQVPHQTKWAPELSGLLDDIGPGFHRFVLDQGQISLTLCIGPTKDMLTEQRMQADWVALDSQSTHWDVWTLKALSRCCKRGALLETTRGLAIEQSIAKEAGFEILPDEENHTPRLCFNPPWNVLKRAGAISESSGEPSHCVVIGAGLSGASVAHALALRGWQITVLDNHPAPAGGASGLPVGLVVPHISADDSARSRMSRNGSRFMLQQADLLLQSGVHWARSGVLERRPEGDIWHKHAGWIQPRALVQAWLDHPNIRFVGNARVHTLQRTGEKWTLLDVQHKKLAAARHVVFANAMGCQQLLENIETTWGSDVEIDADLGHKLALMQALHGTLSSGSSLANTHSDSPVNGNGSFIPSVPRAQGMRWFAGSTFELDANQLRDTAQQHMANQTKLCALLPDVSKSLQNAFETGEVEAWTGTRCVSHDRLPLVGPLEASENPNLWISAAMGARGLSFSALCAQWLVARMCAEPLPVEASLARSLDVTRQRRLRP